MLSASQPDHLQDLRDIYASTRSQFLASKHEYESFHNRLQSLPVPSSAWFTSLTRHHSALKKTCHSDLKQFLTAAQNVQRAESPQPLSKSKPEPEPEPEPPPPPPAKPARPRIYDQTIYIRTVDGKTQTRYSFDADAAHWIKINASQHAEFFRRHFVLEDGFAPPEYSFVLEHDGDLYPPSRNIFIQYDTEEFMRICHREIESQSPHALDGLRSQYWHHDESVKPTGKIPKTEPEL
jgi:hypothetical protein